MGLRGVLEGSWRGIGGVVEGVLEWSRRGLEGVLEGYWRGL